MQVKEIIKHLEALSPLTYAEDFDNVGLLVGDPMMQISGILVTLDTLESVVDEAIERKCNMIVSFHPIVFKGIKKFNGNSYVQRVVMKAIKYDIAIFAIHTALDNSFKGVNHMICQQLELINQKILIPKKGTLKKISAYTTLSDAQKVELANLNVKIKNAENKIYIQTSNDNIHNKEHFTLYYQKHIESKILSILYQNQHVDTDVLEIQTLENKDPQLGMGMIGELPETMEALPFLKHLKEVFKTDCIRHSKPLGKPIKKVAVLGGSGSFAIKDAIQAKADIFITADMKYHQFYEAENKIIIADIGHYESEQYTKNLIVAYLRKKISNFEIIFSDQNTNPIQYL